MDEAGGHVHTPIVVDGNLFEVCGELNEFEEGILAAFFRELIARTNDG